ncbi:MAG: GNAT family N-acetyltransferase [Candidatus Heimdallarchaeota archaeon]|nr:GNAT family N-acetyltransferase [Candidatus Heimdallarchaeota archaeon]
MLPLEYVIQEVSQTDSDYIQYFLEREYESSVANLHEETSFDQFKNKLLGYLDTQKSLRIMFILLESHPISYIWIAERSNRNYWDSTKPCVWIYDIKVDPEYRRRGLGEFLINSGINAYKADYSIIGLHVFGNNHSAIRLYEKTGFRLKHLYMQKDELTPHEVPPSQSITPEFLNYLYLKFETRTRNINPSLSLDNIRVAFNAYRAELLLERIHSFSIIGSSGFEASISVYASKGDLGDQEYCWIHSYYHSNEETLKKILSIAEGWALDQQLTIIRFEVLELKDLAIFEHLGYRRTNLFYYKELYK